MIDTVIICRMLSKVFLVMNMMAFQAMASIFCSNFSSYSIACPVPLPASLLVRLVLLRSASPAWT